MELAYFEYVHLGFYLTVNKLISEKMENIFYLVGKNSVFIKYILKEID